MAIRSPPPDLDFLGARRARAAYEEALARGAPDAVAWCEAVEMFAAFHPAWPRPLIEREAMLRIGELMLPVADVRSPPRMPVALARRVAGLPRRLPAAVPA